MHSSKWWGSRDVEANKGTHRLDNCILIKGWGVTFITDFRPIMTNEYALQVDKKSLTSPGSRLCIKYVKQKSLKGTGWRDQ